MEDLAQLLDGAANGDDRSTRALVRLTQGPVTRLCRAMGSGDDVDDLVQETYLRAFRSLHTFRGEPQLFVPWLLAIARNVCTTEVERRIRRRDVLSRLRAQRIEQTAPPAGSGLEELVRTLPVDLREAFVLTQVLGLSYEEAAVTCGCPIGTIRSRVSRARSQLFDAVQRAEAHG